MCRAFQLLLHISTWIANDNWPRGQEEVRMHAFQQKRATTSSAAQPPSEELKIAVTFKRANGEPGLTKFEAPLSVGSVKRFAPDPLEVDRAVHTLRTRGFVVSARGALSVSVRGTRKQFEEVFRTQ